MLRERIKPSGQESSGLAFTCICDGVHLFMYRWLNPKSLKNPLENSQMMHSVPGFTTLSVLPALAALEAGWTLFLKGSDTFGEIGLGHGGR
jgi:hypothetical protein